MPSLVIIAGPNGAGKSTVSASILEPYGIQSFDYDSRMYSEWKKFDFDPAIEEGIRNKTSEDFHKYLTNGFKKK
ncbi:hypothetical protein [Fulvivirga sp.]|uniref:hypothetical protein n=1 Tax=Fulvivirga sp. TaxID=1931237 RepID=UPI0032ED9E97